MEQINFNNETINLHVIFFLNNKNQIFSLKGEYFKEKNKHIYQILEVLLSLIIYLFRFNCKATNQLLPA